MSDEILELVSELSWTYRAEIRRLAALDEPQLAPFQNEVIGLLGRNPGATPNLLSELTGRDRGQITRLLVELEKMGLVGREKSPADGRSVILSLTTKGDSLFKGVLDKRAEMARIMLQQFDDAQQKALADMLSKLIESLKSKPDRAR